MSFLPLLILSFNLPTIKVSINWLFLYRYNISSLLLIWIPKYILFSSNSLVSLPYNTKYELAFIIVSLNLYSTPLLSFIEYLDKLISLFVIFLSSIASSFDDDISFIIMSFVILFLSSISSFFLLGVPIVSLYLLSIKE